MMQNELPTPPENAVGCTYPSHAKDLVLLLVEPLFAFRYQSMQLAGRNRHTILPKLLPQERLGHQRGERDKPPSSSPTSTATAKWTLRQPRVSAAEAPGSFSTRRSDRGRLHLSLTY